MPVQGTVKPIVPRSQERVPKSSPGPRDNRFDCSLNRHEITVYYKKDMFINFLFTGKLCNELFAGE